ncbi:hypothetical protein Ocin01_10390 [Orchesella cincta]|uniref:E3 ubiquitin-protein ligase RNF180 n=1 Tax=Orchesella cincta TaxID=48709 RepID=A0A1D2MT62_ORCCI|nr:hypothetical protein Ocin01_10390 [Orchesella cincta]
MDSLAMKCRKCRSALLTFPETRIETSHGVLITDPTASSQCSPEVWYIPENHMPQWMTPNLDQGKWVKGKIQCPKCDARLGSYNFISGMKCPCGSQVVAPIHIVKSKVDFFLPLQKSDAQNVVAEEEQLPKPSESTNEGLLS